MHRGARLAALDSFSLCRSAVRAHSRPRLFSDVFSASQRRRRSSVKSNLSSSSGNPKRHRLPGRAGVGLARGRNENPCLTTLDLWCSRRQLRPCKSGTATVGDTRGLRDLAHRPLGWARRSQSSAANAIPSTWRLLARPVGLMFNTKRFERVFEGDRRIAFADFRGNKQHISTGNLITDNRAGLILVDYPRQLRLKTLGRAEGFEGEQAREWIKKVRTRSQGIYRKGIGNPNRSVRLKLPTTHCSSVHCGRNTKALAPAENRMHELQ